MPRTSTKTSVEPVINIHNFQLKTDDRIYEVVSKYDADAPDGYKEHRTTKLLNDSAGRNTVVAAYDSNLGLWDTGLYEGSPMYRGMNEEKKKQLVQQVNELIVEPFENLYGEGKLDPRDKESKFWNVVDESSFKVDLYKGKIFNTNNVLERLQLFIALAQKDLAPKEHESSPIFNTAQFCIEDKDKVRDDKVEKDTLELEANGQFFSLLQNPRDLKYILNYVGVKNVDVENKSVAIPMFKRWIENKGQSYQNQKMFLEAVSMNGTKVGKKELEYFTKIETLIKKGAIIKVNENYMLGDIELGNNPKGCAINVAKDTKIQAEIDKLL